ncbi:family 16 glycosylhydrolase [Ruminococcus flavefaciens]|uniref:family 16 glycosylhydrolase n=1 Tax=Ruminococcus flavefaciens TaxID=1265 RepID=UPI0004921145|nr:family 16 glycosylhydrolase [Ruminococcus flavefaciens]
MKINKYLSFAAALAMLGCAVSCGDKNSSGSDTAPETAKPTEAATEAVDVPEIEGYNLLWNDEFSGSALDESKWNYEPHEPGWTNEELQEYTTSTDNVFLRDGKLVIKAIKSEKNGKDYYTSGKVTGQNKTDFSYGKVVVSAKVPEGQGLWPAIWMMPKEESYYGQWPKCGEIDIMEVLGNDVSTAYGTLHFGEPHGEIQGTWGLTGQTYADSFHEYSVEWEPGEIRWYIDGNLYNTANDWFTAVQGEDEKPYPAPFDQPFFVQMNLAVGGTWPGNPDATTDFDKAEFEIDYVRVYQKPEYNMNVKKPEKKFREALEDGNFIFNGDFSEAEDLTDDVNWKFLLFNGGEGSAEIKDNMIVITSQAEGTEEYSVQLVQPDLPMIKGKKYRVTFDAYADEERDIVVCVSAPSAGWIRYLQDTKLTLTTEKQSFTYDFEMKEKDDNNGRLEFNMGKRGSTATVYISNVRVEEIA